jgi:hypothetical protein
MLPLNNGSYDFFVLSDVRYSGSFYFSNDDTKLDIVSFDLRFYSSAFSARFFFRRHTPMITSTVNIAKPIRIKIQALLPFSTHFKSFT